MALPDPVARWFEVVHDPAGADIDALLADDVVFRSPAVHTPQEGRVRTLAYLQAAVAVLGPTIRYRRTWHDETSAVLEFEAELDAVVVHGVDMLSWNEAGLLTEFTVMVRPVKGLHQLIDAMSRQLSSP